MNWKKFDKLSNKEKVKALDREAHFMIALFIVGVFCAFLAFLILLS